MIHARFTNTYSEFHSKCATPAFGWHWSAWICTAWQWTIPIVPHRIQQVECWTSTKFTQLSSILMCKEWLSSQYMMSYHVIDIYITTYHWNKCIHMLLSCGLAHFISSWLSSGNALKITSHSASRNLDCAMNSPGLVWDPVRMYGPGSLQTSTKKVTKRENNMLVDLKAWQPKNKSLKSAKQWHVRLVWLYFGSLNYIKLTISYHILWWSLQTCPNAHFTCCRSGRRRCCTENSWANLDLTADCNQRSRCRGSHNQRLEMTVIMQNSILKRAPCEETITFTLQHVFLAGNCSVSIWVSQAKRVLH